MKILSKKYWDNTLSKVISTFISVKVWVLVWTFFLVLKLYQVADSLREFFYLYPGNVELIKTVSELIGKIYDISNAVLIGVVVVIVLSRETYKHSQVKQSYSEDGK